MTGLNQSISSSVGIRVIDIMISDPTRKSRKIGCKQLKCQSYKICENCKSQICSTCQYKVKFEQIQMYFQQQNFFPQIDNSHKDLNRIMDLSIFNEQSPEKPQKTTNNQMKSFFHDFDQPHQPNQPANTDSQQEQVSNESNGLIRNGYSKYENEIKELLPQIHSHLIEKHYNQYQKTYQERLETYKSNLANSYKQKIEVRIDQIKQNINSNLLLQFQQIEKLKHQINTLKKPNKQEKPALTQDQQEKLIEKTVGEIFNSERLLNEIKQKLKPKVEERVRFILIRDLEKDLNKCQNEIQDKIAEEREEFKAKRKSYWEEEAENELKDLAVEFQQLKEKKTTMERIVKEKLSEKQQLIKKYKDCIEKSREVKQLQKSIKQMEQKNTRTGKPKKNTNNTRQKGQANEKEQKNNAKSKK